MARMMREDCTPYVNWTKFVKQVAKETRRLPRFKKKTKSEIRDNVAAVIWPKTWRARETDADFDPVTDEFGEDKIQKVVLLYPLSRVKDLLPK